MFGKVRIGQINVQHGLNVGHLSSRMSPGSLVSGHNRVDHVAIGDEVELGHRICRTDDFASEETPVFL